MTGARLSDGVSAVPQPFAIHDGLAVYRIGQGPPVLLMPAPHRFQQPGDGTAGPLVDGLVRLGRQVISYDPPGAGRSTRKPRISMREMHDCADEALAVAGASAPVDAMGHSMSGLCTLAYAIERPDRVHGLILIGTGTGERAYLSAPGALWNRSHPGFWPMVARAVLLMVWHRRAPETILNNYIRRQSFVDRSLAPPTEVAFGDWVRPPRGHTEWHRRARHLDYAGRLGEVEVPTLILCGRQDPQYPPACSQELAVGIPQSRLVWFDHSGHFPFREEPDAFWHAVELFLQEADRRANAEPIR